MVLYFVLALFFFRTISSASLVTDFHTLVALKQVFRFPEILTTWDSSLPSSVCSWDGVQCSSGGRVVSLDLTDLNLSGSVDSNVLSKLDKLRYLSLAGNNFTGWFHISNMNDLKFLNISTNVFSGGLDLDYKGFPNLEVFDAYDNNFSTSLPLGVLSLESKLKHLDFGGNYFEGEIPSDYGKFTRLEYLSLAGNNLRGKIPGELGNLTSLKEIYLGYYNVFEGGIPYEFGNLVSLVHMDVSSCGLVSPIPREIGNLKSLDTLYLHTNEISGSIPRELGNLTSLVYLDLSNNALTGEIPLEFANLKQLKLFNLFMNKLHGSIPDFVAELPNVETLGLWMNNFTGEIPRRLGSNKKLQILDLSSNKLTGQIPEDLCASKQLRILVLMKNFLFGKIPEKLGFCYSLTRVRLGQNYLNGSIPEGFIYLPNLNLAELHNNYLSGTLSENTNTSSKPINLVELNLSNNLISGLLPYSISNLSSIQILTFSGNKFSGAIPASIGDLYQLLRLDLSQNSLFGSIPPEIGNLSHLTYLDMSRNNLSGSIPTEISNIRVLNYLNLSRNHFDKTIPTSIGSMKSLTNADFSFNDLSGKLPESGQFNVFKASAFAGNPHLCGSVLNNPCSTDRNWKRQPGYLKLIFALGLLICLLVVFASATIKVGLFKKKDGPDSWKMTTFQALDFTVHDVLQCAEDGNVIGRGGAGIVYHGRMPNGAEVATKKLLNLGKSSHDHGFRAEIETLGNIRHRNIVKLLAFCSNQDTNLLVYEYMKNGSLGDALHGKKGPTLSWRLRYTIAIEAAKGLCYLHHDCSPVILHRDVKSNNILLDSSFEAHVADFGLAKFLVDGGPSECMSAIAGSYGYIAPEYAYTLKVDEKSDVYSYGVVLLELLTGRRPVGDFGDGVDIVQWVRKTTKCRNDGATLIVDHRLTNVPKNEAKHLFFVAMLCVQENSIERPTMRDVVRMLVELQRETPIKDVDCV